MTSIYMIFSDLEGGDSPSTLHYMGIVLKNVVVEKIKVFLAEKSIGDKEQVDEEYVLYVCKFDLKDGGLNMYQDLVDENAHPELIKQNNIFKGRFKNFVKFINAKNEEEDKLTRIKDMMENAPTYDWVYQLNVIFGIGTDGTFIKPPHIVGSGKTVNSITCSGIKTRTMLLSENPDYTLDPKTGRYVRNTNQ